MDTNQQQQFLEKIIEANRNKNAPDLLREFRMREEQRRLNQARSFYRSENWSL